MELEAHKDFSMIHRANEEWRTAVGYEGLYEVSNQGRVRQFARSFTSGRYHSMTRFLPARILKMHVTTFGYIIAGLTKEKQRLLKRTHVLVAQAFIPNPDNKPQVNHKDGIKINNNLSNLEWATCSENVKHAYANNLVKTLHRGESMWNAKLTTDQVRELRRLFAERRCSVIDIAKKYGLAYDNVFKVAYHQTYACVDPHEGILPQRTKKYSRHDSPCNSLLITEINN